MQYRVCFRQHTIDDWQDQEFADYAEARRFKVAKERQIWSAFIQTWNAREQRWIG
jgi:hypothetical protein